MIPILEEFSLDAGLVAERRVVLLDDAAEEIWLRRSPSSACLHCQPDAWREAEAWLAHGVASSAWIAGVSAWAARRLGLDPETVPRISAPLRTNFASRLVEAVDDRERSTAMLASEVLGWQSVAGLSLHQRLAALAVVLPFKELPWIVIDARKQLRSALELGDALAIGGIPLGLRINVAEWWQFLSSEDWSRSATRWRMADALRGDSRPPTRPKVTEPKTIEWINEQVPAALPVLEQARIALSDESTVDASTCDKARSAVEAFLFAILSHRSLTRNRFRLNVPLDFHFGPRPAEADLAATDVRLVVEVDGYYHFREQEGYRRDRRKDAALQEHGWFVLRFLAEDVLGDPQRVVEQIEHILARRCSARLPH